MSAPLVLVFEGLFFERDGIFLTDTENMNLSEKLSQLVGRVVEVVAHHDPPRPPILDAPGLGCCFWAGNCPCGHDSEPTELFSQVYRGVLGHNLSGIWQVGGESLPIQSHLLGHRSRLVLLVDGEVNSEEADPENLLREAQSLLKTLETLRNRS